MSGGWNTIESDAGVFTYLLDNLGVKNVQFEDLLSLDPHTLAQLYPIYGIIFLFRFPTNAPYVGEHGEPRDGTYDYDAAERIFFARQTIQNACGTQALLSVLLNKVAPAEGAADDSGLIDIGPHLRAFREFAMALPPDLRGEALGNDERIRSVHNSFAKSSPFVDETDPARHADAPKEDVFHFIAYTAVNGRLYELDGLQPAPIDHGPCDDGAVGFPLPFANRVIAAVRRRIERYGEDEIHFSLMAAVQDRRVRARAIGDTLLLATEARKRRAWQMENALRRHNFVGFAHQVLEGVIAAKLDEGRAETGNETGGGHETSNGGNETAYDKWVNDATERLHRLHEQQRPKQDDDVQMDD